MSFNVGPAGNIDPTVSMSFTTTSTVTNTSQVTPSSTPTISTMLPIGRRTTLNPDLSSADRWLDIETKAQGIRLCDGTTVLLYSMPSDPSVGMCRVASHIRGSLPNVLDARKQTRKCCEGHALLLRDLMMANETMSNMMGAKEKFTDLAKRVEEARVRVAKQLKA
eukprot:PhF_6_TR4845/c0_g1_i1/m.6759